MAKDYKKHIIDVSLNDENELVRKFAKNKLLDTSSTSYNRIYGVKRYIQYIANLNNVEYKNVNKKMIEDISYVDLKQYVLEDNGHLDTKSQNVLKYTIKDFYIFYILDDNGMNDKLNNKVTLIEIGIKPKERYEDALKKHKENKDKSENKDINTEHINKLIANIESKRNNEQAIRDLALVCTMFSLALRASEAQNLNYEDIDFENETIIIKSNKTVDIKKEKMHPELKFILETYTKSKFYKDAERKTKEERKPLFYAVGTYNEMPLDSIYDIFNKYGIEDFTSHAFRKYGTSKEYMITGDIYKAMKRARHQNINTTTKYYITEEAQNNVGKYKHMFDGVKIKLLDKYYIQQECLGGKTKDEKEQ